MNEAYNIQTPGNHPEENIQHTEHGESLKSKIRTMLLNSFLVHAMKEQEGMEIQLHLSLTLVLDGCYWSASHPGCFTCGEPPPPPCNTHLTGGRVASDAAWVVLEKRSISYLSQRSNRYFLFVQLLA
jgi:hypothetical protein